MAFTSHIFLFYFLPVLLAIYYVVPGRFLFVGNVLLLAASYAFYAWLDPRFAALLLAMTVVNYALSRLMCRTNAGKPRLLLTGLALAIDLTVLGFFKYMGFFVGNLDRVLLLIGADVLPVLKIVLLIGADVLPVLKIVLPVGISFYTFKLISYIVDVHRGRPPARSLLDFACYVAFFPQLLSGPIQRFSTLDNKAEPVPTFADQLSARVHTLDKFSWGVALFMLGFAKKILLADSVAQVADAVFAAESPGTLDAWFGALAYSFQLYFDFSAYSEMAIGLGLMLGFECPRNFDAPYRAAGFSDFWRRWHTSLSSWLRDYLYIPLGGSRYSSGRTYANLAIVFLLCGLWHGAGWTFVVWGAWHGLWLVIERALGRRPLYVAFPARIQMLLTFLLVTVGWVVFRAETLAQAWRMLATMFTLVQPQGGSMLLGAMIYTRGHLILMASCALLAFQPVQGFDWTRRLNWPRALLLIALFALAVTTMFTQSFRSFLYFQF